MPKTAIPSRLTPADAFRLFLRYLKAWQEDKHPRDDHGEFSSGDGDHGKAKPTRGAMAPARKRELGRKRVSFLPMVSPHHILAHRWFLPRGQT